MFIFCHMVTAYAPKYIFHKSNEILTKQLVRVLIMMREVNFQDKTIPLLCLTHPDKEWSHGLLLLQGMGKGANSLRVLI